VLEVGPWLKQLGWDLAPLGPPSVVIHGVPSDLHHQHHAQVLQDILDGSREAASGDEDISEHLARTYACHAAVRAGDALSLEEMRALVDRLFATTAPHGDPHGRVDVRAARSRRAAPALRARLTRSRVPPRGRRA
jgi:DNA mismatch repair protein MutL